VASPGDAPPDGVPVPDGEPPGDGGLGRPLVWVLD
jgi:hypothetical protein